LGRKGVKSVNREVIRLALQVAGGVSDTIEFTVPGDCTVERLAIRIYEGAALLLQLKPFIKRAGSEIREPLVRYAKSGKQYIDGEDESYKWTMSIPAGVDDVIGVDYVNSDADAHDFAVDVELDYAAGIYRMLEGPAFKGVR
jgi:hypothetical protein